MESSVTNYPETRSRATVEVGRPDSDDRLDDGSPENLLANGAGQGNDVELIIMNLYSKMKNLEGKYIDLANFYKQELVRSNKKVKNEEE